MMRSTTLFAWFALSSFLSLGVGACRTDDGAPYPQLEARSDTRAGPSLSPEATAALVERFQAELDAAWTRAQETDEHFPGATAAFILPDGRVFGFATGHSDVDDDIPMTPDLRMGSGSIGKTYVAAVALQLAMNGELDLDAPVSTWLGGEEWFSRVPNHTDLTVRNLLNHTAGMIQPYFEDPDFASGLGEVFSDPDGYMTPEQFIAEACARQL